MKNLKPYLKPGKGEAEVIVLLVVSAFAALGPAFLVRVLFDRVVPDRNVYLIVPVAMLILFFEVLGVFSQLISGRALAESARGAERRQRFKFVELLTVLNLDWFDSSGPGSILRHHEDAGVLGGLRVNYVKHVIGPLMVVIVTLPPMIMVSPVLTAFRLFLLLPALAAGSFFLKEDLVLERQVWEVSQVLATHLFKGAQGMPSLKESASAGNYARHLRGYQDRLGFLEEKRRILNTRWEAVGSSLGRIGGTVTPLIAVSLVLPGRLSFGSYIAFSIIAGRCITALTDLLGGLRKMAQAANAAKRHKTLADSAPEQTQVCYLGRPVPGKFGLCIENVSFRYSAGSEKTALDGLSLNVREGETLWIQGASGCGKSTLLSLILGFKRSSGGCILWRGLSLPECPDVLRASFGGSVLQDPVFFPATIRENLCLFGTAPPDRRIWAALEAADAAEIVANLPGGLDSSLQGEGAGLSGGERRRLAVARLILRRPPLVLLDEPLVSLDEESSVRVADSLKNICMGRTVIMIHHGKECPLPVDRQVLLSNGRIHELKGALYEK